MKILPFAVSFAALAIIFSSAPAHAEWELYVYGGKNWNFDAKVETYHGAINDSRTVGWDGKSFTTPPYWGGALTYWFDDRKAGWGVGIDYVHAKAYANINFVTDPVFDHLEFTHGLNLIIPTGYYRFLSPSENRFVPYVGAGVGVALPHVEVRFDASPDWTSQYELAGPAAQILAGAEMRLIGDLSFFGEGKLSYARIDAGLSGGGSVRANIWSPQAAVGFSYRF